MTDTLNTNLLLCLAALVAGAVNSIAGGGTLLTFPTLLAVVHPVVANATSTVALVPGSMAGAWGYRRELQACRQWAWLLIGPCLLGGIIGALLVTKLDERYFAMLVPWLILGATLLFMSQPVVGRLKRPASEQPVPGWRLAGLLLFQLLVAIYGGYFGAGIGILMISALGLLGLQDIHQRNALKTVLAACINAVSVGVFVFEGKVNWSYAWMMALAAIAGGYLGAHFARRLKQWVVRWIIIAIGFGLSAYYLSRPATVTKPERVARIGCPASCSSAAICEPMPIAWR